VNKLGNLLGRKPPTVGETSDTGAKPVARAEPAVVELDQELFFPIATQLGEDNEMVRNLLIDAEHKISELDAVKRAFTKLVDPVSRTLRAYEEAKSQKFTLETQLNTARAAFVKQRDELDGAQNRVVSLDADRTHLHDLLTSAQQRVALLEGANVEQTAELNARRIQVVDLQRIVQQLTTDVQRARDDGQHVSERITLAERRVVQLDAERSAAQQKLALAENEKAAVQKEIEKAQADASQFSRKATENNSALTLAQHRLAQIETSFGEVQAERVKLATALDETAEKLKSTTAAQNARCEALQARATTSETLLDEARKVLTARADENAALERRVAETMMARGAAEARHAEIERAVLVRDTATKALEQTRAELLVRNDALTGQLAAREIERNRAQDKLRTQIDMVRILEDQIQVAKHAHELRIEDLEARLQRERLERTMAEGALEAGRKDIARLLRELSAAHYRAPAAAANDATTAPAARKPAQSAA
jgi:chromosome segregation ATPase